MAATTACAGGTESTPGVTSATGASASATAGSGGTTMTGIETTGISGSGGQESSTSADPTTSGDPTDDTTTSGDPSTSTTGGGSTDTGSSTGAETDAETDTEASTDTGECDLIMPDNTCETATGLTAVSGDDGSSVMQTGTGSTWLQVQVQETNGSIFEEDLSYLVELESPPGVDYDLFVYEGPQDGDPNCAATPVQGAGEGAIETVSADWDDDQGLGGEDDSLWLSIEIVHVTGTDCDAAWTLTVTGGA